MLVITATAVGAAGSNTTQPTAQPTPPPLTPQTYPTNFPPTANVGAAVCGSQLDNLNVGLQATGLALSQVANSLGLAGVIAEMTGAATNIVIANPSMTVGQAIQVGA